MSPTTSQLPSMSNSVPKKSFTLTGARSAATELDRLGETEDELAEVDELGVGELAEVGALELVEVETVELLEEELLEAALVEEELNEELNEPNKLSSIAAAAELDELNALDTLDALDVLGADESIVNASSAT